MMRGCGASERGDLKATPAFAHLTGCFGMKLKLGEVFQEYHRGLLILCEALRRSGNLEKTSSALGAQFRVERTYKKQR